MVRFKYRYFAVKFCLSKKTIAPGEPFFCKQSVIMETIRNKIRELHGDYGIAAVDFGLQIKYCNNRTQIIIIRAQHGAHRFVATTIPLVKQLGLYVAEMNTLYVGASIRHCFLFIQKYQKQELKKIWHLLKSDEEKKDVEKAFMDINYLAPTSDFRDVTPFNPLL